MAIQSGQSQGGLGLNIGGSGGGIKKLLGLVTGVMTGGAAGAAIGVGSTAGSVAGGIAASQPNSPVGRALGLYGLGKQVAQTASDFGGDSAPQNDGDAMTRSLQSQQQSPQYLIHQGLQDLSHPDVVNNLPQDVYMKTAEALLRAKHYGIGGGLDQTPGDVGGSGSGNGQIENGGYA